MWKHESWRDGTKGLVGTVCLRCSLSSQDDDDLRKALLSSPAQRCRSSSRVAGTLWYGAELFLESLGIRVLLSRTQHFCMVLLSKMHDIVGF